MMEFKQKLEYKPMLSGKDKEWLERVEAMSDVERDKFLAKEENAKIYQVLAEYKESDREFEALPEKEKEELLSISEAFSKKTQF